MFQSLLVDQTHNAGEFKGETYFPHGIINDRGGVFSSDIYLTRSEHDIESAQLNRYLESSLRYGERPDITVTLRSIGEQAKQSGKKRVAVLVCGPSSMVHDVINKSILLSWEMKVHFDVHREVFEF